MEMDEQHARKITQATGRDYAWGIFLGVAEREWRAFASDGQALMSDDCLSLDGYWMFFKNPDLHIPDPHGMRDFAVIVEPDGGILTTPNFYPDLEMCRKALKRVVDHIQERNRRLGGKKGNSDYPDPA